MTAMDAPSAAKASEMPRPIPLPPPVTKATCPSNTSSHYNLRSRVVLVLRSVGVNQTARAKEPSEDLNRRARPARPGSPA